MPYKTFKTTDLSIKEVYHLMISGIVPRPIAYVGTCDKLGNHNLAPFSFYNGFGANPPIIGFSPALSGRTGKPKDTLINIKSTKKFTISLVSYEIVEQMSLSSSEYENNVDEFIKSGLSKFICSNDIPAVQDSPFIMECSLYDIIELGNKPASGNLILGQVNNFFVDPKMYINGKINPNKLDPVSRLGYNYYSRAKNGIFTIHKPKGLCIGFDALPDIIKNSTKFSGNELGKLASVLSIPSESTSIQYNNHDLDKLYVLCKDALYDNQIDLAWQIVYLICKKTHEK